MYQEAMQLIQNWMLSPGALETQQRTDVLPLASLATFKSLRQDPYRRLTSLAAANELSLLPPNTPDPPELFGEPRFEGEWGDATSQSELLQLVRDVWTLLLLGHEVWGRLQFDWFQTFVIGSHELYARREDFLPPKAHGLPRRPRLLRVAGAWLVYEASCQTAWRCPTALDAVAVWATLLRDRYRSHTDDGLHFELFWSQWLAPPEPPRLSSLRLRLFPHAAQ